MMNRGLLRSGILTVSRDQIWLVLLYEICLRIYSVVTCFLRVLGVCSMVQKIMVKCKCSVLFVHRRFIRSPAQMSLMWSELREAPASTSEAEWSLSHPLVQ